MQRKLCLVTGASAGIGAALARVYARHGWDLALTARREERLRALAAELAAAHGTDCLILPDDMSDEGAPERLFAAIAAQGRTLDGLVNNAGAAGPAGLTAAEWGAHAAFIQLMMAGPTHLARLVLPGMIARGYGRILNVCSIAGMLPPARGQSLYGASKAYLTEASRAMNLEGRGAGVHVTALCPGLTRTEFHAVGGMTSAADSVPAIAWQSAERVARAGYAACEKNVSVRIPGLINKAAVALFRALPQGTGMALMAGASGAWERKSE